MLESQFLATERDVADAVRLLNLSGGDGALVVDASDEQRFALAGLAGRDGLRRHLVAGDGHPLWIDAAEDFVVSVRMLGAAEWNVGDVVRLQQLARDELVAVASASDVDRLAVLASLDGSGRNLAVRGRDPAWRATAAAESAAADARVDVRGWWSTAAEGT